MCPTVQGKTHKCYSNPPGQSALSLCFNGFQKFLTGEEYKCKEKLQFLIIRIYAGYRSRNLQNTFLGHRFLNHFAGNFSFAFHTPTQKYFEQKQESQSDKYSGAAGIVSLNSHSKNTHAVCKLLPFPCGVDFCLSHQVSSLAMPLRRWVAGLGIPINIQFHPGQPTHPSGYNDPETGQDRSSVGHSIRS